MTRAKAAAALLRAAAAAAARRAWSSLIGTTSPAPPAILQPAYPRTPPPPRRQLGPWRPRIRPELRTVRERVIIYYLSADLPVGAALAAAGWPVGAAP